MEIGELVLGKVNLNAFKKTDKKETTPHPVIEILDNDGNTDGEIVVLKVLRVGSTLEA